MGDIDFKAYNTQLAKELTKRVVRKFPRRKVITYGKNDVWAGDLVDMGEWVDDNDGYRYMLNVIDVFTRYAWSVPLKTKGAKEVLNAFKKILSDSKEKPSRFWTDNGSEFYNKELMAFLKKERISLYSTYGDNKAAPVERFNRTLKSKMWQQLVADNSRRWIDILDDLMKSYNNTKHSTIKMTPTQATKLNEKQEEELLLELNENKYLEESEKKKPKFKVGDWVRISRIKGKFEKGYIDNWRRAVHKIVGVSKKYPFVYYLEEYDGEPLEGSFYEEELQKAKYADIFLIEKELKTRNYKGKKQVYVKWLGWDDKYNSWIDADSITEKTKVKS